MPDTFTIELLGFPALSNEAAEEALLAAFDIEPAVARLFVASAPCPVRTRVAPDAARRYVRGLLVIGAELSVVNERTGQSRIYRARDFAVGGGDGQRSFSDEWEAVKAEAETASDGEAVAGSGAWATVFCPKCGYRQVPQDTCVRCSYVFPTPSGGVESVPRGPVRPVYAQPLRRPHIAEGEGEGEGEGHEDVDVFENIRRSGHYPADNEPSVSLRAQLSEELSAIFGAIGIGRVIVGVLVAAVLVSVVVMLFWAAGQLR